MLFRSPNESTVVQYAADTKPPHATVTGTQFATYAAKKATQTNFARIKASACEPLASAKKILLLQYLRIRLAPEMAGLHARKSRKWSEPN